jgi:hypothetical protein
LALAHRTFALSEGFRQNCAEDIVLHEISQTLMEKRVLVQETP